MHAWILFATAGAADLPFSTEGCEALDQLKTLEFTFNIETAGEHKLSRRWVYHPATRKVERTMEGETMVFTFGSPVGEAQTHADLQFINDSFWLLPTCHMAWAREALTVQEKGEQTIPVAPVGKAPGRAPMVTVQYDPAGGGYTPGDAYDLYLGPNKEIVAWSYRKRGAEAPTLSTDFTDYVDVGPLRVAREHTTASRDFRVFFTDLSATR